MKPIKILSATILLFLQNICFGKNPPPVIITQPANQTVCAGSPASFTVTATGVGLTYQWRKGNIILIDTGSISGVTTATLTISPTTVNDSASNYNVIISEPLQPNDTSANARLIVNPLPAVVTGPVKTMCYGDTIQIGGAPVAGNTYKWTPNKGLSSSTIANPLASPADTIMYVLTVTDTTTGCKNSDSVLIKVKPVPTADITPGDTVNFCMGDSVILTATNGASYIWSDGSTTKSITVKAPGKFYVGVIYSNGCADYTDPTTVTSSPLPTANAGPDKSICLGDSTQIGTVAGPGMSYSWSPSTGLNYDTIAQPQASPTVTTKYILTVTDTTKGCKNTDTVIVTVFPLPVANAGRDTAICRGDSVTIGSVAIAGVKYNWTPATGLSSDIVAQPKASPGVTTTYVLTTKNSTCSNTDTVTVTVNPLPVANAGPDKSICKGDSAIIGSVSEGGVKYTWSPTSGLSSDTIAQPKAGPANTTTYTLTTTNGVCTNTDTVIVKVVPQPIANAGADKTICKKDSVSIGSPAVAGTSYKWMPASGLSSDTVAQPNASPASTTSYILTSSNGICSNTDTVVVNVNPLPAVNAGPNKSICKGDSTSIGSASSPGITYSWAPATGLNSSTVAQPNASPTVTTTYTVTVTNSTCSNTDTVIVTVIPQPIANAGPNKTICKNDSVQIGSVAVSGVTYKWSPAAGLSSSTNAQPYASPSSTTTYTLTATNGICSNTDTVVVTVDPLPTANAGSDKTICRNDSTSIGTSAVSGLTYSWSPTTGLNSAVIAQPNASPASTTLYTLKVSNGSCSNTDTVTVSVNQLPAANVGNGQFLCDAGSVTLGGPAVSGDTYVWSPATGLNSSTISQPTANPDITILYTLTETDTATGCTMSNQILVTVVGNNFYTGISPNGDGINDWWNIPMLDCYPTNNVIIVNRWGSEVWSADNYDNNNIKWAGTDNNGAGLPDGTYYYIIKYNNTEKKGWVFIKR